MGYSVPSSEYSVFFHTERHLRFPENNNNKKAADQVFLLKATIGSIQSYVHKQNGVFILSDKVSN